MRNILILTIAVLGFLISGIFIVDQREVGVVQLSANKARIYAPGIHWMVPFSGKLRYVYTNLRTSYIAFAAKTGTKGQTIQLGLAVNWQVIKPAVYSNFIEGNSRKILDAQLASNLIRQLESTIVVSDSVSSFENYLNTSFNGQVQPDIGIRVVSVALVSTNVLSSNAPAASLPIESAYEEAQKIKLLADNKQKVELDKLKAKDSKFFDYFMKINTYSYTATSKQDIPELNKLYSN